jgi:light-regulated signal transduction histidine kinase (bacteriophytochrome)
MQAALRVSEDLADTGSADYARALLNILEDSAAERGRLYETHRAVLNILEDSADEKITLEQTKRAVLNILEDLAVLNETLDRRVKHRTALLQEANRELEAFSYSVSHDLRAPLRAVEGFAKILLRDYTGKALDEKAADYMNRMSLASQRMGILIEDLLTLSRITRQDLKRQRVSLSELAMAALAEFARQDPERAVDRRVEGGLIADADPRLMQVVLNNLLGNAWKFTARRHPAIITFGMLPGSGSAVYFVRDNGAGFDMAYADQLFLPFQRLHRAEEFEGTGIGLATVQRVIRRHGGRIWGVGAEGGGATFYFTLGGA